MQKGVIFSIDLVIALIIVVLFLGIFFNYYNTSTNYLVENKITYGLDKELSLIKDYLAYGNDNCYIKEINKKIAFCLNTSKISKKTFLEDFDYTICVSNNCFLGNPSKKYYFSEDINMLVSDKDLSKQKYFECTNKKCDLYKKVTIYVWKK